MGMAQPQYLVIISGLSGSGKSYVQSTLEDLGFYCCDNLPIQLIEPFLDEVSAHQDANRVGIVVDVRTHDFANVFPQFYRERIQKRVPHVVLIFLEATDEVLARRYSETRRPHPAESALHRRAAAANRARSGDCRVSEGAARVRDLLREAARFRDLFVAGVPERDEELPDHRNWLHGRAAPLGGHRAEAGRRP